MTTTETKSEPAIHDASFREAYLNAYRWMLLGRLLDEKYASLNRSGKIFGGVFLGKGQEALSVAVGQALKKTDVFAPLIRDAAGRLAFGEPILDAVRTYMGSPLGPMRARDGNVHRGRPKDGYLPMISHLGASISVVNGVLIGRRFKGDHRSVGAACIGDGATSTGAFHEALNQAALEKLPLLLIVADNQYAYSTPTSRQYACDDLTVRAAGYGVRGHHVDGTDLSECLMVIRRAIEQARDGDGPQLIIAQLLRLCGHGEHDDASYVDEKLRTLPVGRDCLHVAEQFILENEWADPFALSLWRKEALQKIDTSVMKVQRESGPDPYKEDWTALASRHLSETFYGE